MKAIHYLGTVLLAGILFSCDSHTYEELEEAPVVEGNITYNQHIKPIIDSECVSCHSVQGGYRPLTNYAEVKDAVQATNLLDRIQRQNGEPGAMPQGGRMTQSKIDLILQWNEDGLLEN